MGLELNTIVGPGRKPTPLSAMMVRELEGADVELLASGVAPPVKAPPLARITERHHAVARLIAAGVPPGEVALITNYELSRISILQASPAFQELVALYSREVEIQFSTTLDNLAGMANDAIQEIRVRLEEEPESFSLKDLRETAEMGLNRVGYPESRVTENNINVSFGERLEAARKRAKAAALGETIIEAEIVEDTDASID